MTLSEAGRPRGSRREDDGQRQWQRHAKLGVPVLQRGDEVEEGTIASVGIVK